jgi:hypothetical protein
MRRIINGDDETTKNGNSIDIPSYQSPTYANGGGKSGFGN